MEISSSLSKAFSDHSRLFLNNRYVYPVLSRRSGGISIGINLNLDKLCNFDCIYCQVDRRFPSKEKGPVMIEGILRELHEILGSFIDGSFYSNRQFREIQKDRLVLKDIAFSGDGEPSLFPEIFNLTQEVISLKNRLGFLMVKVVMITNATGLTRPETMKAIDLIYADGGEIWAKLDAGTPSYFQKVCRTGIDFNKILNHILQTSQKRAVVIQTCLMKIKGVGPTEGEIEAYCQNLNEIQNKGGKVRLVQIYTLARRPTEEYVQPLENREVDQIVEKAKSLTGLAIKPYYQSSSNPD
jgi:wyosine [tRNA(Phe)-imidazoG37] synthetase (radical SAM superfamily)